MSAPLAGVYESLARAHAARDDAADNINRIADDEARWAMDDLSAAIQHLEHAVEALAMEPPPPPAESPVTPA